MQCFIVQHFVLENSLWSSLVRMGARKSLVLHPNQSSKAGTVGPEGSTAAIDLMMAQRDRKGLAQSCS